MASRRSYSLEALGLNPELPANLPTLLQWLESNDLTAKGSDYDFDAETVDPTGESLFSLLALAQATGRQLVQPKKPQELKDLKEKFKSITPNVSKDQAWEALTNSKNVVRALQWDKLPADSMAFYRPFHIPPFDQWGIYLLIGPLLRYHHRLVQQSAGLRLFSAGTLMHLILFEVFNHEFFHHLVESTATTLEIILATQGKPQAVYLRHRVAQRSNVFRHPHVPLEEALANAYAYNALGFISRVKVGFKTASVKAYQKAVAKHWNIEPPGYCEAGSYIGDGYIDGGAMLLAQLLHQPDALHQVPLSMVAKNVMPSGFMALLSKPDIPTWLVGSEDELNIFNALVPAPNEAYTQLFWPYNTDAIDQFIDAKRAEEQAKKKAKMALRSGQENYVY